MKHQFTEYIPAVLEEDVVYVSIEYGTASHLCCCGCGEKVVTPITPTDWQIIFNGEAVSLHPSIGNWSFACRSHYWIKENRIIWAGDMSNETVENIRLADIGNKTVFFEKKSDDWLGGILHMFKRWFS
jgi:hypothetical protein